MLTHDNQPFFHRRPEDDAAAIAAFRRLHLYAVKRGDRALAALAILKAIQKLENEAERDGDTAITSLVLPAWVRSGVWDALAQLLGKKTPRGRSVPPFASRTTKLVERYRRWVSVKKRLLQADSSVRAAAQFLGNQTGGGSERTLERSYIYIENVLKEANAFEAVDDTGEELQRIEARDLIPTQKLEAILDRGSFR